MYIIEYYFILYWLLSRSINKSAGMTYKPIMNDKSILVKKSSWSVDLGLHNSDFLVRNTMSFLWHVSNCLWFMAQCFYHLEQEMSVLRTVICLFKYISPRKTSFISDIALIDSVYAVTHTFTHRDKWSLGNLAERFWWKQVL